MKFLPNILKYILNKKMQWNCDSNISSLSLKYWTRIAKQSCVDAEVAVKSSPVKGYMANLKVIHTMYYIGNTVLLKVTMHLKYEYWKCWNTNSSKILKNTEIQIAVKKKYQDTENTEIQIGVE